MMTPEAFDAELAAGPFAWPGGYPRYFVTHDGEALSFEAATAQAEQIRDSLRTHTRDGWAVVAVDVNWEDTDLTCAHSGEAIESAYGEPDGQPDEAQEWADFDPDC